MRGLTVASIYLLSSSSRVTLAASSDDKAVLPSQIRVSATADETAMLASWATPNTTLASYVPTCMWGSQPGVYPFKATGSSDNYTAWGIRSPSLHMVTMTGLKPGRQTYYYICGDEEAGFSDEHDFQTAPTDGTISFIFWADMGIAAPQGPPAPGPVSTATTAALMAQSHAVDMLIFGGDIGYADRRQGINNGTIADGIMDDMYNEIQGATAYVPTVYSVGNHELQLGDNSAPTPCLANGSECRGLAYVKRVARTMPTAGSGSPFWFSFNYGPVHLLSFSTEHPYSKGSPQWQWIQRDLESVDRAATPWTIAFAHRPMYCSNTYSCALDGPLMSAAFEEMWNNRSTFVDAYFAGHAHCYERMLPLFNGTLVSKSYANMTTPLYMLAGSPGCMEGSTPWQPGPPPQWSAYRACEDVAYGFARVSIANATAMRVDFVNSADGSVLDGAWITKAH